MTPEPMIALEQAARKLASLAAAGHPAARRARSGVTAAIEAGLPADQVLAQAGAPAAVVRLVRDAAPADLPAVLQDVAAALGRAESRHRALADLALYPLLLAGTALCVGAVVMTRVRPAMDFVAGLAHPESALAYPSGAMIALGAGCVLLIALAVVLTLRAPIFPLVHARMERDRALLLSAAAALAERGAGLPIALRAAGNLVVAKSVRASAQELAGALERGDTGGQGQLLLGSLGAGIFGAAASQGAGAAALSAAADLQEAHTESGLPAAVLQAEILALVLGGAAIAASAGAFMLLYSRAFGAAP